MKEYVNNQSAKAIRSDIGDTLEKLLDGSDNKTQKIDLLKKKVLDDQHIRNLTVKEWETIFTDIMTDIYQYIDDDSSEGQDILNLFFIAFNKYTGKADKNQAFTPDHITEFMCRVTDIDWTKKVLDATCGSGSFLVQAMVKELADARKGRRAEQASRCEETVRREHIYGIECEEKAYGLATTNMLIHADGNSNIVLGSCFDNKDFIKRANPDIILMNPPYNAKPKTIPDEYKTGWGTSAKDGKEDPTKGLVFIHYLSDIIKEMNDERQENNKDIKTVKLAVLLPLACAIGTSNIITAEKEALLENNTLEAVFSLPAEMFYPGASVNAVWYLQWDSLISEQMELQEVHSLDIARMTDSQRRKTLVVSNSLTLTALPNGKPMRKNGLNFSETREPLMVSLLLKRLLPMMSGFVKHT